MKTTRSLLLLVVFGVGIILFVHVSSLYPPTENKSPSTWFQTHRLSESSANRTSLHLLLPATDVEVNLCKTLLTTTILGYPVPRLLAWKETFENKGGLLGGGSHIAKISGVLQYLEQLDGSADSELVLMADAYDIWFQLPPETLVSRYHAINDAASLRLKQTLGRAVEAESLQQTIVFGAGKRCAPNQMHTVGCIFVPPSPLAHDLYGNNTDTIMGRNKYTSLRQRYLNSGYIMGPVKDMRSLFRRAQEKVDATPAHSEWDNGSHGSDMMYHGSDQSIFNIIFGEQEYEREVFRRRYRTEEDELKGIAPPPEPTWIEGTLIDDPLSPSFTHETITEREGESREFGISLDYFSQLGQQTVNSEEDCSFITYNENIEQQLKQRRGLFDCPQRVTGSLPDDILQTAVPGLIGGMHVDESEWSAASLYTNVCLDQIPVMIHHNGDKTARHTAWPNLWIQEYARSVLGLPKARMAEESSATSVEAANFIVARANSNTLNWNEVCPSRMWAELFRDS